MLHSNVFFVFWIFLDRQRMLIIFLLYSQSNGSYHLYYPLLLNFRIIM